MAYIHKSYVGDQIVTRSKKKIIDKFGIGGCYVRMNINLQTEVMNWLEKTDPKNAKNKENGNHNLHTSRDDSDDSEPLEPLKPPKPRRRNSVVAASLFSVNNYVEEHSSDYLQKIQRPCALKIKSTKPAEPTQRVEQLQYPLEALMLIILDDSSMVTSKRHLYRTLGK